MEGDQHANAHLPVPSRTRNQKSNQVGSAADSVGPLEAAVPLFKDILEGATIEMLDIDTIYPLIIDRPQRREGIHKMKRILHGLMRDGSFRGGTHLSSGSGIPVAVRTDDIYVPYLRAYLLANGSTEREVDSLIGDGSDWYGLQNGNYRFWALQELQEEAPDVWGAVQWPVLVLRGSPSVEVLTQMKRNYEEDTKVENIIESTLHDRYRRLLDCYRTLCRKYKDKTRVTAPMVAQMYDRAKHSRADPVARMARNAILLGPEVIEVIGEIMEEEHPCVVLQSIGSDHPAKNDPSILHAYEDCRIYKNFLTDGAIRHASAFCHGNHETTPEAQINTVYRMRLYTRKHQGKTAPAQEINRQYHIARIGLRECKKFEKFLGTTTWPTALETMHMNILRGNVLDQQLLTHEGNTNDILPILWKTFSEHYPSQAAQKLARFKALQEAECAEPHPQDEPHVQNGPTPEDGDQVEPDNQQGSTAKATDIDILNGKHKANRPDVVDGTIRSKSTQESRQEMEPLCPEDVLKSKGIEIHNCSWETYFTSLRDEQSGLVDFVFMSPPHDTYKEEECDDGTTETPETRVELLCKQLTPILRDGCYAFVRTSKKCQEQWATALASAGLDVSEVYISLIPDVRGGRLYRCGLFPQEFTKVGIVARKPGNQRKSFMPDLTSAYTHFECRYQRRHDVIDNIPHPDYLTYDNSRRLVDSDEISPLLVMEVMRTYCPASGVVFDAEGGTLHTATAAVRTGRKSIVLQSNTEVYKMARNRLVQYITMDQPGLSHRTERPKRTHTKSNVHREIGVDGETETQVGDKEEESPSSNDEIDHDEDYQPPQKRSKSNRGKARPKKGDNSGVVDPSPKRTCNRNNERERGDLADNVNPRTRKILPAPKKNRARYSGTASGDPFSPCEPVPDDTPPRLHRKPMNSPPSSPILTPVDQRPGKRIDISQQESAALCGVMNSGTSGTLKPADIAHLEELIRQKGDVNVTLLNESFEDIGYASMATMQHEEGDNAPKSRRKTLHGTDVDSVECEDGPLVIIRGVQIQPEYLTLPFTYPHFGVDEHPKTLRDMKRFESYLWPTAYMSILE